MALSERLYQVDRSTHPKPDPFKKSLWQGYCLTAHEMTQIDKLMGRALLDRKFCDRLLQTRDHAIFAEYGLSPETQTWLASIQAANLTEFARAITADNVR